MRFLVALVFVLVSVMVAGCAPESRPRCEVYHFQPSFPREYRAAAIEAAARWTAFSGRAITIAAEDSEAAACGLGAVYTQEEYDRATKDTQGSWAARHLEEDGNITIAPFTWQWDECRADMEACALHDMMHEFGHEYGLSHTKNPADVMNDVNPAPVLHYSEGDLVNLASVTE